MRRVFARRSLATVSFAAVVLMAASVLAAEPGTAVPADSPRAEAGEPDGAVFVRLDEFLRANPLAFKTVYRTRSDTLGTSKGEATFLVRHPNLFHIESTTPKGTLVAISDGSRMTIYRPREKKYATIPAPQTAREGLGIVTGLMAGPSRMLTLIGIMGEIAAHRPEILVARARAETVLGRLCDGYTIVDQTATVTDKWRIWLDRRSPALPCKAETSSSDAIDDATQTNEFTWQDTPSFSADAFVFTPPSGAREVSVGDLDLEPGD